MTKIIDEATMATLVQAYREGASLRDLSTSLNEMGFTGPLGGQIHPYSLAIELGKAGVKLRSNRRPEDIDRVVIRMVNAGATQVEIAKAINRSQPSVSAMVRRMRADGRLRPKAIKPIDQDTINAMVANYQDGATTRQLADILNDMDFTGPKGGIINRIDVSLMLTKAGVVLRGKSGHEIDPNVKEHVISMIQNGFTQEEIAKSIGITQPGIAVMVRRMRAEGRL